MNYNISNYMKIKPQINDIVQIEWTPYELELNFWESILILMLWILIQFLGNGLLLGLIQYNRFGEDPLKRRISDQVSKKNRGGQALCASDPLHKVRWGSPDTPLVCITMINFL